jgi:outer membrane protein TolC
MPLYDGGSRAALLEQARDRVDKAQTTLTQIRNEAARQIVVARNTLKTSLSAYRASTALAAAAQTTFNAALTAYRNGVGSITDVTLAERPAFGGEERRNGRLQHSPVGRGDTCFSSRRTRIRTTRVRRRIGASEHHR